MKNLKFIIIGIIISFLGCRTKAIVNIYDNDKYNWKIRTTELLLKEYEYYKMKGFRSNDSCYHSSLDLVYKINDINRYPFDIGINKIKEEIENKKIRFDSIVCVTTQVIGIDPSMIYENLYFIFEKGSVKSLYEFYPESYEVRKPEMDILEINDSYKYHISQVDGDNMSLLIFTTFKPNWEYEISKITINYFPKFK